MTPFCAYELCENYTEGRTQFCATHNAEQRKAERNARKVKIVKPIRKVSQKQAEALKVYYPKKDTHLKAHPDCQIKILNICQNDRATNQLHHSGKRGKNLTDETKFITACVHCHQYIETVMSAAERRKLGFLVD